MKAVLLSSTYYLDEAVQLLSPNAERMLTRALAFCGNVESSGYISELNITMLGLPNPKKLARELVDAEILVPRPNGGWDFRTWDVWNSAGDALVARRKADRERQARLRQEKKSRDESREMSRDVTPPNRTEQKRTTGYVESASPDSTASEPRSAPVTPLANRLVSQIISAEHPPATLTELRLQASALLNAGQPEQLVADALALWTTKSLHPKTLPSLVSELINSRNQPNRNGSEHAKSPPAARKVGIGLDLAREFANPPEPPALEA
jgi:hypothetical protein